MDVIDTAAKAGEARRANDDSTRVAGIDTDRPILIVDDERGIIASDRIG